MKKIIFAIISVILLLGGITAFIGVGGSGTANPVVGTQNGGTVLLPTTTTILTKKDLGSILSVPKVPNTKQVIVLLDGWSKTVLGSSSVFAVEGEYLPGSAQQPVSFQALPATAIAQIGSKYPSYLEAIVGRLFSTYNNIKCSAAGCTFGSGLASKNQIIPIATIANPTLYTPLASEYSGYGVTSGIYAAIINVPVNYTTLNLQSSISGSSGATITLSSSGTTVVNESYSFGDFFYNHPLWATTPNGYRITNPANGSSSSSDVTSTIKSNPGLFLHGLSTHVAIANNLTSSLLTYMSSPAVGCGGEALCVPGEVPVKVLSSTPVEANNYCYSSNTTQLTAVTVSNTLTYNFKVPTAQAGFWTASYPASSANVDAGLWDILPGLAKGTVTGNFQQGFLVGPGGLVSVSTTISYPASGVPQPFTPSNLTTYYPVYATCAG